MIAYTSGHWALGVWAGVAALAFVIRLVHNDRHE